jgi:hypothetical protein
MRRTVPTTDCPTLSTQTRGFFVHADVSSSAARPLPCLKAWVSVFAVRYRFASAWLRAHRPLRRPPVQTPWAQQPHHCGLTASGSSMATGASSLRRQPLVQPRSQLPAPALQQPQRLLQLNYNTSLWRGFSFQHASAPGERYFLRRFAVYDNTRCRCCLNISCSATACFESLIHLSSTQRRARNGRNFKIKIKLTQIL